MNNKTTNLYDLATHRESKKAIHTSKVIDKTVPAIDNTINASRKSLIALIDNKSFSFKKPIDSIEEFEELIAFLKNNWIEDITVYLKNGNRIINPEESIWQDTFKFSDEASILLFELCSVMYNYTITERWTILISSK